MSELKPCDHCNGEYDPQMGATVHHHNCPNLHFPSSPAAPADLVEKLLDVFRSAPLHGDAGCDKLCDDEWRTIATAAIAAMQLVVEALEGVNARLRKANELRMEETHKERDEAKLWFEKAQEWKQENARLSDDAARYCWLRDHSVPPHNFYIAVPDEFGGVKYSSREVDAYIDEARAALEVGGGDVG